MDESSVLAGVFPLPRLQIESGKGSWVHDQDGKRYLDFTTGLGVMALGHAHPLLADVLQAQYLKLAHCSNLFANAPATALAQKLVDASFASKAFFANSGAEVNEAALKFARLVGGAVSAEKRALVAFERGFHGRTMGALSVTYTPAYRKPFEPLIPDVRFARFNDLQSVAKVMGGDVCGVIVEPVQGEGGVHPAERTFLQGLRQLCDKHEAMLIFDEVQCGMGRTGRLFAHQNYGVVPDIMTLAKPLGGGLPIGACLVGDVVARCLKPGQHGTTFGGGPAATALAGAVFDIINQPQFLAEVSRSGTLLANGLQRVVDAGNAFSGVRGMGLMQALVVADPARVNPSAIVQKAASAGPLVPAAGDAAVRFLPPMNVPEEEIDVAVGVMATLASRL